MIRANWISWLSLRRLMQVAIAPATATILLADTLIPIMPSSSVADAQSGQAGAATVPTESRPLTLRSDIQEANAKTGVITARGNVQIYYPARQIQATSAQAQYFSRERRIVLSGDVYVLQEGNSLRGETITYLVDEGRFVALPQAPKQVEAIYIVKETPSPAPSPAAAPVAPTAPANPFGQPEFSNPPEAKPNSPSSP